MLTVTHDAARIRTVALGVASRVRNVYSTLFRMQASGSLNALARPPKAIALTSRRTSSGRQQDSTNKHRAVARRATTQAGEQLRERRELVSSRARSRHSTACDAHVEMPAATCHLSTYKAHTHGSGVVEAGKTAAPRDRCPSRSARPQPWTWPRHDRSRAAIPSWHGRSQIARLSNERGARGRAS